MWKPEEKKEEQEGEAGIGAVERLYGDLAICLALQRMARNTCSPLRLDARAVAGKCNASSRRLRAP